MKRLVVFLFSACVLGAASAVERPANVPEPVYEAAPEFVDLYYKAWELAKGRIQRAPGMPSEFYMDENLIKCDFWIWDTCFMSLFCKYAPDVYPGVNTFDNFYAILLNDGSFKIPLVPCDNPWTKTKVGDPTPLSVHIADNPPLFAWAELRHARMTGDKARLVRVLKEKRYLQRYYDFVENFKPGWQAYGVRNPVVTSRVADGYYWAGGQSGMDNTPRGKTTPSFAKQRPDNPDLLWLDLLAQQALAAKSIAEGLELLGEAEEAKTWRAKYDVKAALLNRLYWDEQDGFYYDVFDSTKKLCKVTTVASFWAMAAGIASPKQAERMCLRLYPGGELESAAGVASLSRKDADYSPKGQYWRGSVWLPTDYMTIKSLEDYGKFDLARDLALKTVRNQYVVYTNTVPHTIWECYAPDIAQPATTPDGVTRVAKDFCGWSALGPISLFIENVIGLHAADGFKRELKWRLPPKKAGRVGVRRYRFGGITCDLLREGETVTVRSDGPFTLWLDECRVDVASGESRFHVLSADRSIIPCSEFEILGGWAHDTQFRVANGFSYLIAHGLGKRVDDAMTTLVIENEGDYDVWARTMNWTARWSAKSAAGMFKVALDDVPMDGLLGRGTAEWQWQKAGRVRLAVGRHRLSLKDLTGFDGRCAAIALTRGGEPPAFPGKAEAAVEEKTYDLVVAGGGIAGLCAAVSAARSGLKVALVHNRAVLGGNNSSEIRVHMGGHLRCGDYPHLGDLVSELAPREGGNAREAAVYEDDLKLKIASAETNLTMFLETTVVGVEKDGASIASVRAVNDRTGKRYRLTAPLFVDATGDGALGAFAGADFRVGRESKAETGEKNAPEKADTLGMGSSCQWRAVRRASTVAFPEKDWMLPISDSTCTAALRGDWDWETGLGRDQVAEAERIRDYGMLVAYSNWSYVKNRSSKGDAFADAELDWVAYNAGKRESRRLLGDVILSETDIVGHRRYSDGTCLTSWSIDLHYPLTEKETGFKGESFRTRCEQQKIFLYPISFGCLYSRNVPNLFMAGRDISVTHIALGTVRVMRTTGMMGEVVGMAAAVCKEKGCRPRDVRESHFPLLAERMKEGVGKGLPMSEQAYNVHPTLGINPDDPDDVARHRNEDWGNVDLYRKGK